MLYNRKSKHIIMLKIIKKITLSSLSILSLSLLFWSIAFLNPSLSYAYTTQVENIAIHSNSPLVESSHPIVLGALNIIKKASIYNDDISIDLCLNDDNFYPNLHPLIGDPYAYAFSDKTVIKNCEIDFAKNTLITQWEVNNNETRRFNLTYALAHEFTHNLQYHNDFKYVLTSTIGKLNWKLEGHADYVSREYQNDGKLKQKIDFLLEEEKKDHTGIPVFDLEDGTKQSLNYFKYSLMVQYILEVKGMTYQEFCKTEFSQDTLLKEMVEWRNAQ